MWCSWNIKQVLLKCISNSYTDFTDSCTSIVKSTNATVSLSPVLISFIVFCKIESKWTILTCFYNFCKEICCLGHRFLFCNWPYLKVFFLYVSDLWIVNNYLIKHLEWTQWFVCFLVCISSDFCMDIWCRLNLDMFISEHWFDQAGKSS